MSEYALQLQQISKTYGGLRANDAIDFQVRKGTIHALAGENGAGKSTLMKILFGLVEADKGSSSIFINGQKTDFKSPLDAIKLGVGMVQQHFALAGPLSALDNIILGAEPKHGLAIDREKSKSILTKLAGTLLKVPWREKAETLSVGLQQRLEILKLLFRKANILILDEPTAVLTPQEVEVFFKLLRNLRDQGKTIILITHKLGEILALCDEVTVLRQGRVTGTFLVKGLTKDTLVRAMIGRDIKPARRENVERGEEILSVKNLTVENENRGSLKNISLSLRRGEILGIAGVEGNGQQTLVETLLGMNKKSGDISFKSKPLPKTTYEIRNNLNIGLISEDRHEQSLWLEASIKENVAIGFNKRLSRFGFLSPWSLKKNADHVLKDYQVKMHSTDQLVKFLSGGNQQKIVIAREVTARHPDLLIASQPTRGVDVGAIEFIHEQLLKLKREKGAILLISSEIEELCTLSDRILVFYEGQIAAEYTGPHFDVNQIGSAMAGGKN